MFEDRTKLFRESLKTIFGRQRRAAAQNYPARRRHNDVGARLYFHGGLWD